MTRILIVDDAIDLGRLLKDALKVTRPDTPMTVVPSAEEALLEASRFKFDLLVTDLRLPGMSGIELIRKIRVRQPEIKIILITALSPDDRLVRQKDEVHPDAFIHKPLSIVNFLEVVDSLIGVALSPLVEDLSPQEPVAPAQKSLPVEAPQQEESIPAAGPALAAESAPDHENPTPDPQAINGTGLSDLLVELAGFFPGTPVESLLVSAGHTSDTVPASTAEASISAQEEGIPGILSRLRGTLGALAAILLDDQGHPVAQAGDLPDQVLMDHLVPAALASLNAGSKVSHVLGAAYTSAVQAFRGTNYDIVLAPAGRHSLVIALKTGRSALRLAVAFEEALAVQTELLVRLDALGVDVLTQPVPGEALSEGMLEKLGITKSLQDEEIVADLEGTPLGADPNLEKFEALVSEKSTGQLQLEDPDSFWAAAAGSETQGVNTPGILSYDQAQKLGLLNLEEGQ